jgi:hypothetical protein
VKRPSIAILARWLLAFVAVAALAWFVLIRPGQLRDQAAETKADSTVASAAPAIARETLKEVERFNETRIEIRDRVVAGNASIGAAAGASVAIPADVDAAGRRALCMHPLYRDDPGCPAVSELRAGAAVGEDAGRKPAGG